LVSAQDNGEGTDTAADATLLPTRSGPKRWGLVAGSALFSAAVLCFVAGVWLSTDPAQSGWEPDPDLRRAEAAVKPVPRAPGTHRSDSAEHTLLLAAGRIEDKGTGKGRRQLNASHATESVKTLVAELIASGPSYVQCCKVVRNYGGEIPDHMQHWWRNSQCRGRTYNATICEHAETVTSCCSAQKEYGNVPGVSWGTMPAGGTQQWWSNTGCDEVSNRSLPASLRSTTTTAEPSSLDGNHTDASDGNDHNRNLVCHLAVRVAEEAANQSKSNSHQCSPFFVPPEKPTRPEQHNGVALQDTCFTGEGPFHAFIIGDWGSLWGFKAAPHLGHRKERGQGFVWPIDNQPQLLVRDQMKKRAPLSNPDYILNVGDDFYWAGINAWCGKEDFTEMSTNQFQVFFEDTYTGPGLDGKQWLGILGNHDYGGFLYHSGWDQIIGYTWNQHGTGRWMNPAQYYRSTVRYPDFSVDYYFLDTNVWDANGPYDQSPRNICSGHNGAGAYCPAGLNSTWICPMYFRGLWDRQKDWLDEVVPLSTADWRIVVTHFPPYFGKEEWMDVARKHEIDFIITGHRHSQFVRQVGDDPVLIWPDWGTGAYAVGYTDFLDPTAWVVSGGGGGITSEHAPSWDGNDDQYGFMDMTLSKDNITVEAISHSGIVRHTIVVEHMYRTTSTTTTTTTVTNTTTSTSSTSTTSSYNESDIEEGGGSWWPLR
jgi:hypothetical protein